MLEKLLVRQRREIKAELSESRKILTTGFTPPDDQLDPDELTAWTAVARVILNLHETITRY